MGSPSDLDRRYNESLATLEARGQAHVLRWWAELAEQGRDQLLKDIEAIPWELLDRIIPTHVLASPRRSIPTDLQPPEVHARLPDSALVSHYEDATRLGRELIAGGKVAAFTVAGGQGTRLGIDGPKGAVPATAVGERTLFEIFATTVKAVGERHNAAIPWYIMTSPTNHEQTEKFLKDHAFFGLPQRDVVLLSQGVLPALDFQGRLLLAAKDRLALAPDGHGGSLKALVRSGALEDMKSRGTEIISYFQVDNPLVKPFDPLFIGLHAAAGSEMSTKVAPKVDDLERVGNVCLNDGKVVVIEYSDFPTEFAHAVNDDGSRRFDAGNLAIHLLNVSFVDRLESRSHGGSSFKLHLRRAEKSSPYVDATGALQTPSSPNVVKLETFVFDALPLAANPLLLEVERAEEFSPVKNATGVDSLVSSKRDQNLRACRWLEAAGIAVPHKADGQPDVTIAFSPSFALDAADVRERADQIPALRPGEIRYIELEGEI